MVVRTRSSSYTIATTTTPETVPEAPSTRRSNRNKPLTTSSFLESCLRTYKVYTPTPSVNSRDDKAKTHKKKPKFSYKLEAGDMEEASEAADVLVSIMECDNNDDDHASVSSHQSYSSVSLPAPQPQCEDASSAASSASSASSSSQCQYKCSHTCLNPMSSVMRYIYKLNVYSMDQTTHYVTAYIIYNHESRLFHTYSIISTSISGTTEGAATDNAYDELSLPAPRNTIQTKYTTYTNMETYIMNIIIPSYQRNYCVLADFIGFVGCDNEFKKSTLSSESCYYDIDNLWRNNDSADTITGHKMFILTPTRVYYWDAGCGTTSTNTMYTRDDIMSALDIISGSRS